MAQCVSTATATEGASRKRTTKHLYTRLVALAVLVVAAFLFSGRLRTEFALWQARRSLESGLAAQALHRLDVARRLSPDRAEIHFLLARANRRLGRFDEVRDHLHEAHRLGWPQELIQREEWLALAQSGQIKAAVPHLSELLRDPRGDGADICEAYVEGFVSTFHFQQGLAIVEVWEADYPDDPRPHAYRGLIFEESQSWERAAEEYRRAVSLAPDDVDYRYRLAGVQLRLQRYAEALEQLRFCGRARPHDAAILCRTAECLRSQGEVDQSQALLQQVLRENSAHQRARLLMGQLEQMAGDYEAALHWLEPLCRETPTDSEARYVLAQALQATGRSDAAREHFAFVNKAREQMLEVQRLTDPDRFQPHDAQLRYEIGIRLLKYDVPSHGAAWLRSVLEFNPNHQPAHAALADYYSVIGSYELAEQHRRHADAGEIHD